MVIEEIAEAKAVYFRAAEVFDAHLHFALWGCEAVDGFGGLLRLQRQCFAGDAEACQGPEEGTAAWKQRC